MGEERPPEGVEPPRVYPPHEVQARLEVSASGLRRLAGIYERTIGPLPRNERGRTWPEGAVEALEEARVMVRESRAVSVEAALRGQELGSGVEVHPATQRPPREDMEPGAAILEELRALRRLVEEQNRRIAELEEAVRGGRELEASSKPAPETPPERPPETVSGGDEDAAPAHHLTPIGVSPDTTVSIPSDPQVAERVTREQDEDTGQLEHKPGFWRRVASWFGYGRPRP